MPCRLASASPSDRDRLATGPAARFLMEAGGRAVGWRLCACLVAVLWQCLSWSPANAQPEAEKPHYLRQLSQQYRAGDWVLQCDSWSACHILGAPGMGKDPARIRPVIMIRHGWKRGDGFELRIALIDGYGEVQRLTPGRSGRFMALGATRGLAPIAFVLGPADKDGAFAVADTDPARLVAALRHWPDGRLMLDGGGKVRLPRGNLDYLLRKMVRLQFPAQDPLSKSERSEWMKEYHYRLVPIAPARTGVPEMVELSCDQVTHAPSVEGWQLDRRNRLWIAQCPESSRLFLQVDGKEPVTFDLKDRNGRVQDRLRATYNDRTMLLEIRLSYKGRGDCGQFVRFGWTDQAEFGMIEHRPLSTCRFVPAQFWPLSWTPTSWRFVPATPPE